MDTTQLAIAGSRLLAGADRCRKEEPTIMERGLGCDHWLREMAS
jgi:hypothetical protein